MLFAEYDIAAIMSLSIPILGILIALFAVLGTTWRKAKVAEYRAVIVQGMVEKGFSVDEIERVLQAASLGADTMGCKKHRRSAKSEYA